MCMWSLADNFLLISFRRMGFLTKQKAPPIRTEALLEDRELSKELSLVDHPVTVHHPDLQGALALAKSRILRGSWGIDPDAV
jgi:hypothetical protein